MQMAEVLDLLKVDGDTLRAYVKKGLVKKTKLPDGSVSYDKDSVFDVLSTPLIKSNKWAEDREKMDTTFDFELSDRLNWWEIPLGVCDDGSPYIWHSYPDKKYGNVSRINCIINGAIAGGKTNLLNVMIAHLLNKRNKDNINSEIYLVDPTTIQFNDYDKLMGVRCVANNVDDFWKILADMREKIAVRSEWLRDNNLTAIPADSKEYPPIFLLIDDYDILTEKYLTVNKELRHDIRDAKDLLSFIIRNAASTNMHCACTNASGERGMGMLEFENIFLERIICCCSDANMYSAFYHMNQQRTLSKKIGACIGGTEREETSFTAFHVSHSAVLQIGESNSALENKSRMYFDAISKEISLTPPVEQLGFGW